VHKLIKSLFASLALIGGSAASASSFSATQPVIVPCRSAVAVPLTGGTTETTLATCTIPAGAMGANGIMEIKSQFSYTNSAGSKTFRVKFGGTQFFTSTATTSAQANYFVAIFNRNATNSQVGTNQVGQFSGPNGNPLITSAVDTTAAQNITITGQLSVGTDTLTLESYSVILYPKG
jgi:hypothetical protein